MSGDRTLETGQSGFDPGVITPTEHDWVLISGSHDVAELSQRIRLLGDLFTLDSSRSFSQPTLQDWEGFFEEIHRLNEMKGSRGFLGVIRLVPEMAKVNSEKAREALNPDDFKNMEVSLREILDGSQAVGLFPGSAQERIIYVFPEKAKEVFKEYGDIAWDSERRYVSWLREESPAEFFFLLAALVDISPEKTLGLLEKPDLDLALSGLRYYRREAESPYGVGPLISHLAALKKLSPVFEQLFQKELPFML